MSSAAMKWARRQKFASQPLKALMNALAARADQKGVTWVSQATLAQDMGATDRTVRRNLALAEKLGVISRTIRRGGIRGRLSDLITLSLHREFEISASEIRAAGNRFNRTKSTGSTGQNVRGVNRGVTYPYQEEGISEVEVRGYTRGADAHSAEVIPFPRRRAS